MVELEDIALRRDYKMKAHFDKACSKCGNHLWLFRKNGIKLRCKNNECFNVQEIPRVCTFCGYVDTMEATQCKICEPFIREITELEINIEVTEKGLKKLGRQLKAKRITREVHDMMNDEYQKEILLCRKKLLGVKAKRKAIEKHLETPI